LKSISRRDFFTGLCSKENIAELFGSFNSFRGNLAQDKKQKTCEEAGMELGKKIEHLKAKKLQKTKGG